MVGVCDGDYAVAQTYYGAAAFVDTLHRDTTVLHRAQQPCRAQERYVVKIVPPEFDGIFILAEQCAECFVDKFGTALVDKHRRVAVEHGAVQIPRREIASGSKQQLQGKGYNHLAYRGFVYGGDNLAFIVDEDVEHLDECLAVEFGKPGLGMTVAYDVEYVGHVSTQILRAQSEQRHEHTHAAFWLIKITR